MQEQIGISEEMQKQAQHFAKEGKNVKNNFLENMNDLETFFRNLFLLKGRSLKGDHCVIIFDEVQLFPQARQAIKYLVADGRYEYIETGSLISIRKNVTDILIPSEEYRIKMYPMDFEEYLWATGDNVTFEAMQSAFQHRKPLGDAIHRKIMQKFRTYMVVGGMPQAVNEYLQTNNFRKVDTIKRDILNLYEDDFKKIDSTGKLSLLFDAIPAQLNKNAARYQVSNVLANDRADSILELIAELKDSKTVLVSYHANDPNAGMSTNKDLCKFKLFLCDTGLFTTLMFKDKDFTENIIYEKLLNDTLNTNLGYLYENIVAQILTCNGNELFYYTFFNETSRHNYEIDFLLASRNKICPIEVKSSGYKTHKSLDEFCKKYSDRILDKYLVYTKDLAKDSDILCLPVYMVPFL